MAQFYIDDEKLSGIREQDRLACLGLCAMAASWIAQNGTGGYIPAYQVAEWGDPAIADNLVIAGIWAPIYGDQPGYLFLGPYGA